MTTSMRWMRRHALAPALLGALAACGGGDDGGNDPPPGGNEPPPGSSFQVLAGGDNVNERYSSDLWVHGSWAYTGTWGGVARDGPRGDVVKIWSLDAAGAPTLVDSLKVPGISTVSDIQASDDGALLVFSAESSGRARDSTSTTSPTRAHRLFSTALW